MGLSGRRHHLHLFRIWKGAYIIIPFIFIGGSILVFVLALIYQAAFIIESPIILAPDFASFLQNTLMSGLFIAMLVGRRGARVKI